MKARRSTAPVKISPTHEPALKLPLEMKIDPAMSLKTQATPTKCDAKNARFARIRMNCAIIDNNRTGFLAENAQFTRKIGAKYGI